MTRDEFQNLTNATSSLKPTLINGMMEFFLQIILISTGFYLSLGNAFSWAAGQFLLGICFWRSFAIMHACGHHAFASNRKFDDAFGMIMSIFCFIPYLSWKHVHQDHHKWTGWIDRDPTMRNLLKEKNVKLLKVVDLAWWAWIPVISIHYILTVFILSSHESRKKILVNASTITLLCVHLSAILILKTTYLKLFGLSAFIYLNIGDLSLLTQHVHIPMDHSEGKEVAPKKNYEQADYSHTMILPSFVSRWIILGFNQHALHHILPKVPYYKTGKIPYTGKHTHHWKEWILKAKTSKVSELIYHD